MKAWLGAAILVVLMTVGCGDGGSGGACDDACAHMVECGDLDAGEKGSCVDDCKSEPWPANFIACRTGTCGLSEVECEAYGQATCEQACDNMITCGDLQADQRTACIDDCGSEPWEGNFIDCRATTCGKSEVECENWTG